MKCLNCGTECESTYCPTCGQKTSTRRFQIGEILPNIVTSMTVGDNKLLGTCVSLLTRPGHMIREYILGKRICFFGPVPLLIRLVAIYAIANYVFSDAMSPIDYVQSVSDMDSSNYDFEKTFQSYYKLIAGNNVYFALYSTLLSVIPYRIVFRKQMLARPTGTDESLNIAEHFVALCYQSCFNMILTFMLIPLSLIDSCRPISQCIFVLAPTIYCIIIYKQMLDISWGKSLWLNIKSLILTLILYILPFSLIMGILAGIESVSG